MAAKNRHNTAPSRRASSPVPDYFVDLTVDSPLQHRVQPHKRPSVLRLSQHAESSQNATILIDEDVEDASNRLLPPKKRCCKTKPVEPKAIVNVIDIPQVNDSVSGETTVLSCPICFEDLSSKRKPTSTRCGHIYCADCIAKTLKESKKCPKCQSSITQKSCIRIYF